MIKIAIQYLVVIVLMYMQRYLMSSKKAKQQPPTLRKVPETFLKIFDLFSKQLNSVDGSGANVPEVRNSCWVMLAFVCLV